MVGRGYWVETDRWRYKSVLIPGVKPREEIITDGPVQVLSNAMN